MQWWQQSPLITESIEWRIQWQNSIYQNFQNESKNLAKYNTLEVAFTEVSDIMYDEKMIIKIPDRSTTSNKSY